MSPNPISTNGIEWERRKGEDQGREQGGEKGGRREHVRRVQQGRQALFSDLCVCIFGPIGKCISYCELECNKIPCLDHLLQICW